MSERHAPAAEQIVGWDHELRQLDDVLARSAGGRGALVVVSGEAGAGKTQFGDEVARRARQRGFTAVIRRCSAEGGAPAFWPWPSILRELGGDAAAEALSPGGGPAAVDGDRFARFQAVTEHLAEVCDRSPVCLVVDDVHAADAGTLLLTRFVADSLPRLALTLVLTRRSGDPAVDDPNVARLLDHIESQSLPIVLRPTRAATGRVPPPGTLGARGQRAAQRWFVGRDEQVDLVRSALASSDRPFSVLFVHGPGGIGKTMLLRGLAAEAATAGLRVVTVDMHTVEASSSAFLTRFAAELARDGVDATPDGLADVGPIAVLVDTFERAGPLATWLWERFVANLPSDAFVVIASRNPPPAAWRADPGWQALSHVVALGNLSAEESRRYLELRGVEAAQHESLVALTHGHPLALSLVVDVLEQRPADAGASLDLVDAPDVVGTLVERFVGEIPDPRRREALAVCAHVRFTTEDLLRTAMGGDDTGELLAWLRSLSFVEEGRYGLFPHDLARDVLDTDLRWRDRIGYEELHARVRGHLFDRIRSLSGLAQQRAVADVVFLHRLNPIMRPLYDWSSLCNVRVERLNGNESNSESDDDRDLILTMTEQHQGPAQAQLAAHWLDRQPDAFTVFRTDGELVGYTAILRLHEAAGRDLEQDPGALAMWRYATAHGPPRQGEVVTAARFYVDAAGNQVRPAPAWDGFTVAHVLHTANTPNLAWDFIGSWQSPEIEPTMRYIDYRRVPDAEFDIGGRHHHVFARDWRRLGWEAFVDMMRRRELDDGSGMLGPAAVTPPEPTPVLSHAEFRAAVREALRDRHRPDRLAANPLVRSRPVRDRFGPDAGAAALAELIDEAAAALAADPRDAKAHRALDRTYLRPAPTQEKAAEVLGLPFSTYRDHLTRGIDRIVEQLWASELHRDEIR